MADQSRSRPLTSPDPVFEILYDWTEEDDEEEHEEHDRSFIWADKQEEEGD